MNKPNKAQLTLNDELKLAAFAIANEISKEAAKVVLEKLAKKEEYDYNAEKYIWENDNEPLKQFESGRRTGRKEGKEIGFFQGFLTASASVATFFGLKYLQQKMKK